MPVSSQPADDPGDVDSVGPVPSTPFHVPPAVVAAWPARGRVDLPALLLATLVIDLEPAIGMALGADPPHGLAHTLLGGTVVGAGAGWLLWRSKGLLERWLGSAYPLRARTAMVSGIIGCWLHVLLDAVMYEHLRPLYPLEVNPLYVSGSERPLHVICALLFLPACVLLVRARYWRSVPEKLTTGLVVLSGAAMAGYAIVSAL